MLLRVSVSNLLSFYKEATFDMFPNPRRTTFQNHIYNQLEIPLLKQAAIYGANGSGKSNLLYVLSFVKKFATNKEYYNDFPPKLNKFKLIKGENLDPIHVKIEFYHKKKYFIYDIKVNDEEVKSEELWISGLGITDNELIFKRKDNTIEEKNSQPKKVQEAINKLINTNPLSSLLSLNQEFPILKDEKVQIAYDWFENNIKILSLHRRFPSIISLMARNNELLKFTNNLMTKIGIGVKKLEILDKDLLSYLKENDDKDSSLRKIINEKLNDGEVLNHTKHDKVLFAIEKENGEAKIKSFVFKQIGIDNFIGDLGYECQSDGTARLINLIPALFEIIKNPCVYLIDELECGIHPKLIFDLMKFFASEKTKGQLIYTTHETALLNQQELMRPDEVWFVQKKEGNSYLYSLNDFKEHNTINIVNGYLDGRYGGIPYIDKL